MHVLDVCCVVADGQHLVSAQSEDPGNSSSWKRTSDLKLQFHGFKGLEGFPKVGVPLQGVI